MAKKNAIRVLGLIQLPFAAVGVLRDYYPHVIRDLGLMPLPGAAGDLGRAPRPRSLLSCPLSTQFSLSQAELTGRTGVCVLSGNHLPGLG